MTTADEGSGLTGRITTALSLTSSRVLDGININCSDGNLAVTEVQETTVMVFGEFFN
ncbi:hypothetical protein SPONN_1632 [uncultured Candidatus Thioglobus sp.]|nr:hypothetical protein SPONN_1632 [uncultured Candidatus Thioglobus sp.]